ncbi:MAG: RDD family protein [Candidatus Levybacteria bacterium]|nr:RDD family protein [Candidatus Levybacteria bacterium]
MKSKYSGFSARFIANWIDGIVSFGLIGVFMFSNRSISPIIWNILPMSLNIYLLKNTGATIGKKIMSIKVIRENGKPLTYSDAVIREVSKILSGSFFFLGYLWMFWDIKKQTWHDKIAKTIVVKA